MVKINRIKLWLPALMIVLLFAFLGPAAQLISVFLTSILFVVFYWADEWILLSLRANQVDERKVKNSSMLNKKYLKKGQMGYQIYWSPNFFGSLIGPLGKKTKFYMTGGGQISDKELELISQIEGSKETGSNKSAHLERVLLTEQLAILLLFLTIYVKTIQTIKSLVGNREWIEVWQIVLFGHLVVWLRLASCNQIKIRATDFVQLRVGIQDYRKIIMKNFKSSYNKLDEIY